MISKDDEPYLVANDMQPVNSFLSNALTLKLKGNLSHYQHIVSTISKKEDSEMLWRLFLALSMQISVITKKPDSYRDIIAGIFSYDWGCVKCNIAFLNLLGGMVTSNVTFLIPTFQLLVTSFIPPLNPYLGGIVSKVIVNTVDDDNDQAYEYEKLNYYKRIHHALKYLLITVPTGRIELFPILSQHFPHKRFELPILKSYASELLQIVEYFPGCLEGVLDLLLTKCLELDVEIVIEDNGEVKINEEIELVDTDGMFCFDDVEQTKIGFRYLSDQHKISNEVAVSADKLDVLLVLIIEFFISQVEQQKYEVTNNVYQALIKIFEERILITFRSKFVQFVLFFLAGYTCNNEPRLRFGDVFASHLKGVFMDPSNSNLKRQCAVMYLASFLSRANFLSADVVSSCYCSLLTWSNEYIEYQKCQMSASLRQVNSNAYREVDELGRLVEPATALQRHETFYLCVQALCYMTSFLLPNPDLLAIIQRTCDYQELMFQILTTSLRPIDYCLHSIKQEFFKVAQSMGIKQPSDADLGIDAGITRTTEDRNTILQNSLDSFFPFDPCLLLSLNQRIDKYYRTWKAVSIMQIVDNNHDMASASIDDDNSLISGTSHTSSSLSYLRKDYASSIMSVALSYGAKNEDKSTASPSPAPSRLNESDHLDDTNSNRGLSPPNVRRPRFNSIGSTGSW